MTPEWKGLLAYWTGRVTMRHPTPNQADFGKYEQLRVGVLWHKWSPTHIVWPASPTMLGFFLLPHPTSWGIEGIDLVDTLERIIDVAPEEAQAGIVLGTMYRLQAIDAWLGERYWDDNADHDPTRSLLLPVMQATHDAAQTDDPAAVLDSEAVLLSVNYPHLACG